MNELSNQQTSTQDTYSTEPVMSEYPGNDSVHLHIHNYRFRITPHFHHYMLDVKNETGKVYDLLCKTLESDALKGGDRTFGILDIAKVVYHLDLPNRTIKIEVDSKQLSIVGGVISYDFKHAIHIINDLLNWGQVRLHEVSISLAESPKSTLNLTTHQD